MFPMSSHISPDHDMNVLAISYVDTISLQILEYQYQINSSLRQERLHLLSLPKFR